MNLIISQGYLSKLNATEKAALQPHLIRERLDKGGDLFCQGDAPAWLFIVEQGCLKVTRSGDCGRSVITELLFPGDICGGLCAVRCQTLSVGAVALEETRVLKVPCQVFEQLSQLYPNLLINAIDCCRSKFAEQREMLVGMALERVEQRAARGLLVLARNPVQEVGRPRMRVALSRREFAELIGTTTETAVRILSEFRKRGLIQEADGEMILLNPEGLSTLAQETPPAGA